MSTLNGLIHTSVYKWQLLEATARAVKPVLEWGESGLAVADGLSNLLKVNRLFNWYDPRLSDIMLEFIASLEFCSVTFQLKFEKKQRQSGVKRKRK